MAVFLPKTQQETSNFICNGAPTGRGAYGTVYKAVDHSTGEAVAIKVISLMDTDADDLAKIQAEVSMRENAPDLDRQTG